MAEIRIPAEDRREGEDQYELRPGVLKDLERIKWYLWHGNVFQALNELQSLEMDLDVAAFESKDENARKLLKGALPRSTSGRFPGVTPLSWPALEGGNPDTSAGRYPPTLR